MEQQQQQQQQQSAPAAEKKEENAVKRYKLASTHYYVEISATYDLIKDASDDDDCSPSRAYSRSFVVDFVTEENWNRHCEGSSPRENVPQEGVPDFTYLIKPFLADLVKQEFSPPGEIGFALAVVSKLPSHEDPGVVLTPDLVCPGTFPRFFHCPKLQKLSRHSFVELSVRLYEKTPTPPGKKHPTATVVVDFITDRRRDAEENYNSWTDPIEQIGRALAQRNLRISPAHYDRCDLDCYPETYAWLEAEDGCRRVQVYWDRSEGDYVTLPDSEISVDQ